MSNSLLEDRSVVD